MFHYPQCGWKSILMRGKVCEEDDGPVWPRVSISWELKRAYLANRGLLLHRVTGTKPRCSLNRYLSDFEGILMHFNTRQDCNHLHVISTTKSCLQIIPRNIGDAGGSEV